LDPTWEADELMLKKAQGELNSMRLELEMMARTLENHQTTIKNLGYVPKGTEDNFNLLQAVQANIASDLRKMARTMRALLNVYSISEAE